MSIDLAAHIAIIRSGQILLTRRADTDMWGLPGGRVESGESVAQAAIREAHEETGLAVRLTRLVGIYSLPGWMAGGSHVVVFAARALGGTLQPQTGQVSQLDYFEPQHLPEPLLWWHRQRIQDALDGVGGSVAWSQNAVWPFEPGLTRQALYELCEQSGLSRQAFFSQHFAPGAGELETLEVGGEQQKADDV